MAIDQFIEFETREDLAQQLAQDVATRMETDTEAGHFASLALSGGSPPKLFLQTLAKNPSFAFRSIPRASSCRYGVVL